MTASAEVGIGRRPLHQVRIVFNRQVPLGRRISGSDHADDEDIEKENAQYTEEG